MMFKRWSISWLLWLIPGLVWATTSLDSREYKIMLEPTLFQFESQARQVEHEMQRIKTTLEQALNQNLSGRPKANKQREIRFFDTLPHCALRQQGYLVRTRSAQGQTELTLKFRHVDAQRVAHENFTALDKRAVSKLEADISVQQDNQFAYVYSRSTRVTTQAQPKVIGDIRALFPNWSPQLPLNDAQPLKLVADLVVYEQTYKGYKFNLDNHSTRLDLALWYQNPPKPGDTPFAAELSFKYAGGKSGVTPIGLQQAQTALLALQKMPTTARRGESKTAHIYQLAPSSCKDFK